MDDKIRIKATTIIEAQFYDLDPMNIVWHGNHVRFLELARCELLNQIGYGYKEMRLSGYSWPVVDLRVRYYRPITFGQKVAIHTQFAEWKSRLKLTYQMADAEDGSKVARAHTVQVAVSLDTKEMLWETPRILHEKLAPYLS